MQRFPNGGGHPCWVLKMVWFLFWLLGCWAWNLTLLVWRLDNSLGVERKLDVIVVVGHRKPLEEQKSCAYWKTYHDIDHDFGGVRLTQSKMALEVLAWLLWMFHILAQGLWGDRVLFLCLGHVSQLQQSCRRDLWKCECVCQMLWSSCLRKYVICCQSVNSRSCESSTYESLSAIQTTWAMTKPTMSPSASSESVSIIHPRRRWSVLCQTMKLFVNFGTKFYEFVMSLEFGVLYWVGVESSFVRCLLNSWQIYQVA